MIACIKQAIEWCEKDRISMSERVRFIFINFFSKREKKWRENENYRFRPNRKNPVSRREN